MRILKLDLRAFGPFTDFELDLSQGEEGLHLVYGPNEAGKSSALRAIEQMLFGIPARSSDDFLHPYANLRVGGTIRTRNGSPIAFLRRKGNKNTLLADDNRTQLDDDVLRPCLGGLDQDLFAKMFGIGHEQLVRGGHDIVHGKGEVGQLLFAAASGIADFQQIHERLKNQAEGLFARRGQVRPINQKLKDLDDAKRGLRQAQLPAAKWAEHDDALRGARKKRDEVIAQLQELERRKRKLERILEAQPLVVRRRSAYRQRQSLGPVPILPQGFADQRRDAETSLRIARNEERTATEELERIERELGSLTVPHDLLAASDRIRELSQALAVYRKAQRDLPGLRAHREQIEADARSILGQLRPEMSLELADQLRLTKQQQVQIQNLGNRQEALVRQRENARAEIDDSQTQLAEAERELEGLEASRDARVLASTIRRILGQGDLEKQRDGAMVELRRAEDQAGVELARLGLWSGTLDGLERLPVPPAETVDRFEAELTERKQRVENLQERLDETMAKRAETDRRIEELRLAGEVPTEEDLLAARQLRDEGWQLVIESWQDGRTDEHRLARFLEHFEAEADLATAYSQAVQRSDALADRLRRESNRVAKQASLQANRDALEQELARYREQLQQAETEQRLALSAWQASWAPAAIEPASPREMRVWLRKHQALLAQAQGIRGRRVQVEELNHRIAACRQELDACLEQLGEQASRPGEALSALIARCQDLADRIFAIAEKRQALEKTAEQLRNRVAAARTVAAKADLQLAQWQDQWAAAIEPLGLPPDSAPAAANDVVARIGELFERLKEARSYAVRIEEIGRDGEVFQGEAEDLARLVAPELAGRPVEEVVEELSRRFQKASGDRQQQGKLLQEQERYREQRQAARQRIEELAARLATMCREAGCREAEELPQAEQNSEAASRLDEMLRSLDEQLEVLAAGTPLESFVAETENADADDLPGQIQQLGQQIEQLQAERDELQRQVGQAENALASIDTGTQASEAAERIQDLLAQISSDVDQYIRFRLAAVVLREAVDRYQEENEAPVLQRASDLFRRLTLGSFTRLFADYSEQGEKVLVGDRGDGSSPVPLSGMSDGTCDQLYLALRLASLEHYLQTHETVPFIVDDILIGFDDGRAAAALKILAELARRTQVIFFTHHAHLVELAREHLAVEELFVYRLPGRRAD